MTEPWYDDRAVICTLLSKDNKMEGLFTGDPSYAKARAAQWAKAWFDDPNHKFEGYIMYERDHAGHVFWAEGGSKK